MFRRRNDDEKKVVTNELAPFDIGLNGTVEEFREANQKALDNKSKSGEHFGAQEQRELQKGAIKAFQEGRPENVQTLLANPDEFQVRDSYYTKEDIAREKILSELVSGNDRPVAVVLLALAKIPAQDQQEVLNRALLAVIRNYTKVETFAGTLIEAGADANAEFDGFKGAILAWAVSKSQPLPVIELLCKKGANFEDTLFLLRTKDWKAETATKLKVYREKITGEPATIEVKPEVLQQMQDQIKELTERLNHLSPSAQEPVDANQPAAAKPVRKTAAKKNIP